MSHFLPYQDSPIISGIHAYEIKNSDINPNSNLVDEIMAEAENLAKTKHETDEVKGAYTATELLLRNNQTLPCLVDPIIPKNGVVSLAGGSDTGKSSFLRNLTIQVVTGSEEFLGWKLNTIHKRAIYVTTEDDDVAISYLLLKANKSIGLSPENFQRLTFIFDTQNLIEKLDSMLSNNKSDLIIIDTFTDLYGKNMNETNQIRTFLNEYSQLAQKHKCLIIFLHHTGKRTEELEPSKNNLLGSQGFEAKMRTVFELRLDPLDANKRHLCIVKANYLPREYKTESFVLLFDEYLLFTMTDERVPFEELKSSNKNELKDKVHNMHKKGMTQIEISKELKISQPTVCRYLKE